MDSVKEVYWEDIREKQVIARSAKAGRPKRKTRRIGGSKHMNGAISEVNVNKFISYDEFKRLPTSLREYWLQAIVDKWHVGSSAIQKMWNLSNGEGTRIMQRLGVIAPHGRTQKKNSEIFFRDFVGAEQDNDAGLQEERRAVTPPLPLDEPAPLMEMRYGEWAFDGVFDAEEVVRIMKQVIPDGNGVCVRIIVTKQG